MHVYCKASFVTVVLITQKYVYRCILSAGYTFVMYTFARKDYSFGERLYLPRKRTGAKQRKRAFAVPAAWYGKRVSALSVPDRWYGKPPFAPGVPGRQYGTWALALGVP